MGGATSKTSADSIAKQLMSAISEVSEEAYTRGSAVNNLQLSGNCRCVEGGEYSRIDKKSAEPRFGVVDRCHRTYGRCRYRTDRFDPPRFFKLWEHRLSQCPHVAFGDRDETA